MAVANRSTVSDTDKCFAAYSYSDLLEFANWARLQLQDKDERIASLRDDLRGRNEELWSQDDKLNSQMRVIDDLRIAKEELRSQNEKLKSQMKIADALFQQRVNELQLSAYQTKEDLATAQQQKRGMDARMDALISENERNKAEAERLRCDVADKDRQIQAQCEKLATQEENIRQLNHELTDRQPKDPVAKRLRANTSKS